MTREIVLFQDVREDFRHQVDVPQWAKDYAAQVYAPRQPEQSPIQRAEHFYQQAPGWSSSETVQWTPEGGMQVQRSLQTSPGYYQGGYGWNDYRRHDAWGLPYQPRQHDWNQQYPNYQLQHPYAPYRPAQPYPTPGNRYDVPVDSNGFGHPYFTGQPGRLQEPGMISRQQLRDMQMYGTMPFRDSSYYQQPGYYRDNMFYPVQPQHPQDYRSYPPDYPQHIQPGYRQPYYPEEMYGRQPYQPGYYDSYEAYQYNPQRHYQRNPQQYYQHGPDNNYYNQRQYQQDYRYNNGYDQQFYGGNRADVGRLNATIQSMVGQSIRRYANVPEDLGCAAFVSAALRNAYGLPIKDVNVANLERTLQRNGFVAVPIQQAQPGDVVIGHRGRGKHGHAAIYMGGDRIANNSSVNRRIVVDGIGKFFKGDFRTVVAYRKVA